MSRIKGEMEGGLNTFFEEQAKLDGKCLVDYVQFDDRYEVVFTDTEVADAKAVIVPRNMTALLDAIGKGVTELGEKFKALSEDERPGRVQVIVVTDGLENASREWSRDKIKELIETQESQWNWDFVFLGTGFDAVAVGTAYGFKIDKTLTFDSQNVGAMTTSLNNYTTTYRSAAPRTASAAAGFTDEDRKNNS